MMPFHILAVWARGLLSLLLLVLGPILLYQWYQHAHVRRPRADDAPPVAATQAAATQPTATQGPATQAATQAAAGTAAETQASAATTRAAAGRTGDAGDAGRRHSVRVFAPDWGFNRQTALLLLGLGATLWAVPKGPLNLTRLLRRPGTDDPPSPRPGEARPGEARPGEAGRTGEARTLSRPDGSELRVELYGPADGPPVVLTHGWGLDSEEWYYARKELAGCRLIVWDLPGLGLSKEPTNHDYSLENLARDLDAVVGEAGGRPVVLVGHSIGGMISLTHAKLFPEAMGGRVCGLVLVNTTYTNPLRTTSMAGLKTALQKPLIEPLLHLTIVLSPLVWLMNWLSYWNGSAHRSSEKSGFSGHETRGQLDFIARYTPRDSPAVLARGMLGMLRYDATDTLRAIRVPTLVVTGDQDPVCKPEASEHMRAAIPAAELLTLAPARHEGLIEHHGRLHEALRAFVLRCSNSARPSPPRVAD